MLNTHARRAVDRVVRPLAAGLHRAGISADAVTATGALGTAVAAVVLVPLGWLLLATVVITVFLLFDLLDGAVAREEGSGTRFGAVLDASCDRLVDGALFGALAWWAFASARPATAVAALACLTLAMVISYIKAKASSEGLVADGGMAERAERMILTLLGTGLQGIGVPGAVTIALWVLAVISAVTVLQRLRAARSSEHPR